MGTNDHLAFLKVEGPWNDGMSDNMEDTESASVMDHMPLEYRLQIQKVKLGLMFQWWQVANVKALFFEQGINPSQIMAHMQSAPYDSSLEKKLLNEMDAFSSNLNHTDYQQFDKSALMCLHINTAGIQVTKEEDGTRGWWLPLKQNFVAWRSMGFQQPLSAFRTTAGLISMTIDESGNLNTVFKGTQLYRNEVDGLDYKHNELDMSTPNELPPYNLPDLRPPPPSLPMGPLATQIRVAYQSLPRDNNLPWVERDLLCSKDDFQYRFDQISGVCFPFIPTQAPTPKCLRAFIDFYPCWNFYLRPSKRHNHGMDSLVEFGILLHMISEFDPSYWKQMAIDEPWDEEFTQAIDLLGLGV